MPCGEGVGGDGVGVVFLLHDGVILKTKVIKKGELVNETELFLWIL